jgi:hypothetical protein
MVLTSPRNPYQYPAGVIDICPRTEEPKLASLRQLASRSRSGGQDVTCGNDRLVFIHVPKTGGDWAVAAMKAAGVELHPEGGSKHVGIWKFVPDGRFTFGFVRKPLTWYSSWWQHCRVIDPEHRIQPDPDWPPDRFVNLPFEQYLEACVTCLPGFVSKLYRAYLGPPEAPVGFVGRYERLADDLVFALRVAKQDFDEQALRAIPPLNVSGPMPTCPPELRDRLRVVEREGYDRFYGLKPEKGVRGDAVAGS